VLPPPTWVEMGAFYRIFGCFELSTDLGYTTLLGELRLTTEGVLYAKLATPRC